MQNDCNMNNLKGMLFRNYGGFADKRFKDLSKANSFFVDDRTREDTKANGWMKYYFCGLYVRVLSGSEIRLNITGNVPVSEEVKLAVYSTGSVWTCGNIEMELQPVKMTRLTTMSIAIAGCAREGGNARARKSSEMWVRTSKSLVGLRELLVGVWANR